MSRTLTAMGDSAANSGPQPSPLRGPYVSAITNRLAPPLPAPKIATFSSQRGAQTHCCAWQDRQPGDPRGPALLRGGVLGPGAQPAAGAEERHLVSS